MRHAQSGWRPGQLSQVRMEGRPLIHLGAAVMFPWLGSYGASWPWSGF